MTNRIRSMFQLFGLLFMAFFIAACGSGVGDTKDSAKTEPSYPDESEEWELVWSDEFEGDSLDSSKWSYQTGDGSEYGLTRWGNNEQQWYTEDNATVADGVLTITARVEEVQQGFPYTSARIRTIGNLDLQYGRVEASIRAPSGQGLWAAFWMLPSDSPYGTWAASGEVDIMEAVNSGTSEASLGGTLHHGFPWPLNQQSSTEIDGVADSDFNVYAIEWEQDEIRWFFNDVHYKTMTKDSFYSYYYDEADPGYKLAEDGAPFDTEFHLLLNLAVGGNLPGNVNDSDLPGAMEIDYVRVYKCAYDLADGSGCNSNVDRGIEVADDARPFTTSYDLYTDAANPLVWTINNEDYVRELAIASFWDNNGNLTLSEVAADDAERGTVIDVNTTGSGNFSMYAVDNDPIVLYGMGNNPNFWEIHAGELRFDLYVDSANTDQDSSFLVKMDSGWPALGYVTLPVADLPQDQWTTVSVKVNDLLANSGDQPLDTSNIVSIFVFEPTGAAHVQIDNISLSCGHPSECGIRPPVQDTGASEQAVFIDSVDPLWNNGIGAWDTTAGVDYFDGNTSNHITWNIVDTGEPGHDSVIQVNFGTGGANGVFFIQSNPGVDMSAYSEGTLMFDLRVPANSTFGVTYKVDCVFPCTTGDQVIDMNTITRGDWNTIEVPVANLVAAGLDLGNVNTGLVIFPNWGDQQGYSFEVDNIKWVVEGDAPANRTDLAVLQNGAVDPFWPTLGAFDELIGYGSCENDGGAACPSVSWAFVNDAERGYDVLEVTYDGSAGFAGLFIQYSASEGVDLSEYADANVSFDIKLENAGVNSSGFLMKVDCVFPCGASDQALGQVGASGWETVTVPVQTLIDAGLDITNVNTGLVLFPAFGETQSVVYRLDNVKWDVPDDDAPSGPGAGDAIVFDAGAVDALWDTGIGAFDEQIGWGSCIEDDGAGCPSVNWSVVNDTERGDVLEVDYAGPGFAGVFIQASSAIDMSNYTNGAVNFDIKVENAGNNTSGFFMKIDCVFPCTSGDQNIGTVGLSGWETVSIPLSQLIAGGLDISNVNTGIVIFPAGGEQTGIVFRVDNVYWSQ